MSATPDSTLDNPEQRIADLERQLAECKAERDEALEQQTATSQVLGVINSSPGDLAPVFDAILEKAHTLCGPDAGSFAINNGGERLPAVATRGYADEHAVHARHGLLITEPGMDRLARGETIHIPDISLRDPHSEMPLLRSADQIARAIAKTAIELTGGRTYLAVPLRKDGRLLGYLSALRKQVRPFSDREVALLQNFAAQAVIAMENARLLTETREALEQQTATAEILQVINSSPGDLKPVFDAMLEKATSLCGAAFGLLFTWDDGESFHPVAWRGISRELLAVLREPVRPQPGTLTMNFARGENIVSTADLLETRAYRNGIARVRALVEFGGARSHIGIALRKDDALLGHLSIFRQEVRPFSDKEIALLQNFAAQAVIAMENARLLRELQQRTEEVADLNRGLEVRVAEQVEELGRVGRLKRFLAPQLAELIVSRGDEKILESHRRDIVVVFCDLRGYTAFTETAEPEDQFEFLRQYHGALGPLITQFEGTLDHFSGDGIMVFFNDPVPCPDPAERAVKMAMAMREAAGKLIAAWRRHGCELGFGVGIAQGYATLGQIGFSDRSGYTAIGTVCNLAARLCAEAKDGQILVSSRIAEAVETVARLEDLGDLELRGLRRPVAAFNVAQSTSASDARPTLTVVAGGPEV